MEYWEACFLEPMESDYDGWLSAFESALPRGGEALDLGCGRGTNIAALHARGMRVTAADVSANALRLVRAQFPGVETALFDMTRPFPLADARFDVVTADLSLHYFSWTDTQRIIAEIARVLRPGGALLARVHSVRNVNPEGLERLEEHYYVSGGYPRRYFAREELERLFDGWTLEAQEQEIVRFGLHKHVFVLCASPKTKERA